jgi:hypothetical protein
MKRFLVVLTLTMMVMGCISNVRIMPRGRPRELTHREGFVPHGPTPESRYLEGFMDGYRSAHPDQPYARDVEPGPRTKALGPLADAYNAGWAAGYDTGRKDVEQRE